MASRILCRRAPAAASKLLRRLTFVPSSSSAIRSFSANATTVDRHRIYSSKDAEKMILEMKADLRALAASCGHLIGLDVRRAWEIVGEDSDGVYFHFDMPGLSSKEHVTVSAEEDGKVLLIRGEDLTQTEGITPCYTCRIEFSGNVYKLDQVKTEMENGLLKVTVPKVMEEEETKDDDDGYNVKIECDQE